MTSPQMDINFAVLDVAPEPYTVTPMLTARISVSAGTEEPVHAVALRCQVRIEPLRRRRSVAFARTRKPPAADLDRT